MAVLTYMKIQPRRRTRSPTAVARSSLRALGRKLSTDKTPQPAVTALEDAELARRILEDPGASSEAEQAELCRRFRPRIRLYGIRHLTSAERADDLAQDVLLIVLQKLRTGGVREPDKIASFILGVARLHARSTSRTDGRDVPLDDAAELPSRKPEEPPDPIARDQMAKCLQGLDDRQRAVVVLTYYGQQSTEDIATSLGWTANHVRVTRHRSIALLRDCLQAADGAPV